MNKLFLHNNWLNQMAIMLGVFCIGGCRHWSAIASELLDISLKNDIKISQEIESLLNLAIKDVAYEYHQTGDVNMQKLEILMSF